MGPQEEVAMDARFYLKFYNQKTLRAMMRRLDKEVGPARNTPARRIAC